MLFLDSPIYVTCVTFLVCLCLCHKSLSFLVRRPLLVCCQPLSLPVKRTLLVHHWSPSLLARRTLLVLPPWKTPPALSQVLWMRVLFCLLGKMWRIWAPWAVLPMVCPWRPWCCTCSHPLLLLFCLQVTLWLSPMLKMLGLGWLGLECHSGRVGSGSGPSGPDPVLGWDQNKIPGTDPNSRRVGVGNSRPSRMHRPPA